MLTEAELLDVLEGAHDFATIAVYADLLQSRGDPRGELIALQLQARTHTTKAMTERYGDLLRTLLGNNNIDVTWDADLLRGDASDREIHIYFSSVPGGDVPRS